MHWFSRACLILLLAVVSYGLIGCAGPGATTSTTDEAADAAAKADSAAPAGPNLQMLKFTAGGLTYANLRRETSTELVPADRYQGVKAVSPNDRYLAVAYTVDDSSKLAIVDLVTRDIRAVDSFAGRVVYSLSWAVDGRALAYGHYRPAGEDEIGEGGISIVPVDGPVRSVGCQAASRVLKWLPDGDLAVRDSDNLYVVESDGCGTVSSLDIRKMHHISFSPDGQRMAYIYRDLVYDRENGEYVPDSTLYLADPQGDNTNELFDDEYRARHLRWSPDGSQLAFDVRSQKDRSRRQIIVYRVEDDRLTYLVPPQAAGSQDEIRPRWSPSGDQIAFTLAGETGRYAAIQVMGQTRTLGEAAGPVRGWAGRDRVVFPTADSTRIVDMQGSTVHAVPADEPVLHVWPVSGSSAQEEAGAVETSD